MLKHIKSQVQKFLANRYTFFFSSMIVLFIAFPLMGEKNELILSVAFSFILVTLLWTLELKKAFLWFCIALVAIAIIFDFITDIAAVASKSRLYFRLTLIYLCAYTIFIAVAIHVLILKIFAEKKISSDTIKGGISVYFLIGLLWAFFYQIVALVDINAFSFPVYEWQYVELVYYSFVTMTTLGYGDITPVSEFARNLAILEAVAGQLFLAIFIARLVGLHMRGQKD